MCHIAGRTVAVDHAQRIRSGIRELMKDARGDVDRLAGRQGGPFLAETHLTRPFQNEINLLLLVVVPRNLSAMRVESYMAQSELRSLNRADAAYDILSQPSRRISPAGNIGKICNHHRDQYSPFPKLLSIGHGQFEKRSRGHSES